MFLSVLDNFGKEKSKGRSGNFCYPGLVEVPVIDVGPGTWRWLGITKGSVYGGS